LHFSGDENTVIDLIEQRLVMEKYDKEISDVYE
jgi:hypothetical protein